MGEGLGGILAGFFFLFLGDLGEHFRMEEGIWGFWGHFLNFGEF